jgi:hypothetical protein
MRIPVPIILPSISDDTIQGFRITACRRAYEKL